MGKSPLAGKARKGHPPSLPPSSLLTHSHSACARNTSFVHMHTIRGGRVYAVIGDRLNLFKYLPPIRIAGVPRQ